jgi:membrane-associated protease RseP (regulator of RpoE activity)
MNPLLAGLVGLLVVLLGLGLSIGAHEFGHLIPAKLFGVRVSKYMIGMGPTLWSRTKGETEYGFKAFPVGGFCRMVGMLPPAPVGWKDKDSTFGNIVANAREESVKEILSGEEPRAFYNLSTPKKVLIMAGGTIANLLLAAGFTALAFAIGVSGPTTTIGSISECVPTATGAPCDPNTDPAPAVAAGLQVGDEIVAFDHRPVDSWSALLADIQAVHPDSPVPIEVDRGGQRVELQIAPVAATRAITDVDGNPILSAEGSIETIDGPFLGIGPTFARQRLPMREVPTAIGEMFTGTARLVASFPVQVYRVAQSMFTGTARPVDSVISVVGVGRAAADVAGEQSISVIDRVVILISLLSSLNMALFVFNLVPLLPLDGGHVINAIYEGLKRTVARIRGITPLPGPADVARTLPIAYVMIAVLLTTGVLLMIADVIDPVRLF